MEDKLVVLEFFSDETEAAVAKDFLEANGISAYVFDNDPACLLSLHLGTNLAFGIRLMVNPSDLQEAQKLLEEQSKIKSLIGQPTEIKPTDKKKQKKKDIVEIIAIVLLAGYVLLRLYPSIYTWYFRFRK